MFQVENLQLLMKKGNNVDYTIIQSRDLTDYVLPRLLLLTRQENSTFLTMFLKLQWQLRLMMCRLLDMYSTVLTQKKTAIRKWKKKSVLENEYYTIEVEKDGSLTIVDKENNVT